METTLDVLLEKGCICVRKKTEKKKKKQASKALAVLNAEQRTAELESAAGQYCYVYLGKSEVGKRQVLPVALEEESKDTVYLLKKLSEEDLRYIRLTAKLNRIPMERRKNLEERQLLADRLLEELNEDHNKLRMQLSYQERINWGEENYGDRVWNETLTPEDVSNDINQFCHTTERKNQELGQLREEILQESMDIVLYEQQFTQSLKKLNDLEADDPALLEAEPLDVELAARESGEDLYVTVYSYRGVLYMKWGLESEIYFALVHPFIKVNSVKLTPARLTLKTHIVVENPYGLEIGEARLVVNRLYSQGYKPVVKKSVPPKPNLKDSRYAMKFVLSTPDIVNHELGDDSLVMNGNNSCMLALDIDGVTVNFKIAKLLPKNSRLFPYSPREYYVPMTSAFCNGWAVHIRRNPLGRLVLVKRPMNPVENTLWFRFMESAPVSGLFYYLGRLMNRIPGRKKTALFAEKFAEKSEEGVFDLFRMCEKSQKTESYFILDKNCPDFPALREQSKNVVAKFSLKYYWLLFNVNYYIMTEAPRHLNMIGSNNIYLRKSFVRHPFIFLQHGVTYLKRQGDTSTFIKGREGEATYAVVDSEKEARIVAEMLRLKPKRIWNTGMLIFDHVKYKHINQSTEDKITVMLTWKPYEESLANFEDSSYFRYTMKTYELLQKYVDRSRINIVAHPHVYQMLMTTSIRDLIWQRPISEVLTESKLLITDYSSVCWNSFYQGGGVVFFQPDLETYEGYVGKLIPADDEYIGRRVFDFDALEKVLAEGLKGGTVNLDYFRTARDERMFKTIVEYSDGKNTKRIYDALVDNGIM